MRKTIATMLTLMFLHSGCAARAAGSTTGNQTTPSLAETYTSNGSQPIGFFYPKDYEIEVDDDLGTVVFSTAWIKLPSSFHVTTLPP